MHFQRNAIFAAGALLLVLPMASVGSARAQTTTAGMCSGSGGTGTGMWTIAGAANLSVDNITILAGSGSPFGRAECDCRSRDIMMRIQLTTPIQQSLGASVAETVWMGSSDCTQPTNRQMTNSPCEQVSEGTPPGSVTTVDGASFTTVGQFYISIPAESLVNPKPVNLTGGTWNYLCDPNVIQTGTDPNHGPGSGSQSRNAYVVVGDNQSTAGCVVPVTVNMGPPDPPSGIVVGAGDGALAVSWSIQQGAGNIENYQVLCRKKSDPTTPAMSADFLNNTLYWFSSCINGTLYRRPMPGVQQNKMVPPPDGVIPPPAGSMTTPDAFPIDPTFICSDRIAANGSSLSARLENLENGTEYEVRVVSIDYFGNPAGSEVVTGTPLPTLTPLQRFCDGEPSACPPGFGCQVASSFTRSARAASGVGFYGMMLFSVSLFGLLRRSRRRQLSRVRSEGRRS